MWWLWSTAAWADPDGTQAFLAAVHRMHVAVHELQSATFQFTQDEYVHGGMLHQPTQFVKYRPDHDIYMRQGPADAPTRQILFRPGTNADQLRVDPGRFLPVLSLDPYGRLARHDQRHTIYQLGFVATLAVIEGDVDRVKANPALRGPITDLGARSIGGAPARCFDATQRKDLDAALYAPRVELCVDDRTAMPASIRAWQDEDGAVRMVEQYVNTDIQVNVGLTDRDFDPATYGL